MGNIKIIVSRFIFKFFISGVDAFALKPFIFLKEESSKNNKILIRHEYVHIIQQRELGLIWFLFLYFYYYFKNLIKYRDIEKAYLLIPFEIEAYASENSDKDVEDRKFHWKKYTGYKNV